MSAQASGADASLRPTSGRQARRRSNGGLRREAESSGGGGGRVFARGARLCSACFYVGVCQALGQRPEKSSVFGGFLALGRPNGIHGDSSAFGERNDRGRGRVAFSSSWVPSKTPE